MEHVTVRRSTEADVEALRQIYEEFDVYAGTLQLPFPSSEAWKKRLSDVAPTLYHLVAEIDGQVVGSIVLEPMANLRRRHAGSIALAVKGARQGQGIGGQLMRSAIDLADNWINLTRLELTVFVDNERAVALYKKHGFEIEGEFADYAYRNGRYANVYSMARRKPASV